MLAFGPALGRSVLCGRSHDRSVRETSRRDWVIEYVPGGLNIAELGDLIDIDVPKVESLGVPVDESLKDGLSSLLVSMTKFQNCELLDRLRVYRGVTRQIFTVQSIAAAHSRSDVGRLFRLRGRSARAASALSRATNSNSAKLVHGSEC